MALEDIIEHVLSMQSCHSQQIRIERERLSGFIHTATADMPIELGGDVVQIEIKAGVSAGDQRIAFIPQTHGLSGGAGTCSIDVLKVVLFIVAGISEQRVDLFRKSIADLNVIHIPANATVCLREKAAAAKVV